MNTNEHHPAGPIVLIRAIEQWEAGKTIPMTLAVSLMSLGYDVEYLEAKYKI